VGEANQKEAGTQVKINRLENSPNRIQSSMQGDKQTDHRVATCVLCMVCQRVFERSACSVEVREGTATTLLPRTKPRIDKE
jgi:hypothetical protein